MKFTIVGAGALGSILATHLQQAGHEVGVLARGKRAEFVQENGIILTGLLDTKCECNLITDATSIISTDVLIMTPKTYHHESALDQVKHVQAHHVFSVANGVLKTEQIESLFGTEHTLGCMANLSGELLDNGEVLFTRNIDVQLGALDPQHQVGAETVSACIHSAGINCHAANNIRSVEWTKFIPWLGFITLAVITRLPSDQFLKDPGAASVLNSITREMYRLATELGIEVTDEGPAPTKTIATTSTEEAMAIIHDMGETLGKGAPGHKMSALQDLENGRMLEIDETMGDALQKAREIKLEMPTVSLCYKLLSAINRSNSTK